MLNETMTQNYTLEMIPDSSLLNESVEELLLYRGQFIIDDIAVNEKHIDRAVRFLYQLHDKFGIVLKPGFSDMNFFGGVLIDIVNDQDNNISIDITDKTIYIQTRINGSIAREFCVEEPIELPADSIPDIVYKAIESVI